MSEHSAENDVRCACHWGRDGAGRLEFRECSEHYATRVIPPAKPDGGAA